MARAETSYNTVTLTDGRIVDFPGKRKMLKNTTIGADGILSIVVDFVNGQTRTFKIPQKLNLRFAAHGVDQKYGDATAGLDDIEDAILAVEELHSHISNGEWAVKRESSGLSGTSVLSRALIELTGKTPEAVKDFLSTKSQGEKLALRGNPKLASIIQRIEAERNKKVASINTDDLLSQLDGSGKANAPVNNPDVHDKAPAKAKAAK